MGSRHPATEGNDLKPNRVDAQEEVTVPDPNGGRIELTDVSAAAPVQSVNSETGDVVVVEGGVTEERISGATRYEGDLVGSSPVTIFTVTDAVDVLYGYFTADEITNISVTFDSGNTYDMQTQTVRGRNGNAQIVTSASIPYVKGVTELVVSHTNTDLGYNVVTV